MIGSLTDLSRLPGMPSDVTLRKLIARHPDFPIIERGTHGRAYLIDLEQAQAFIRGLRQARALDPALRLAAIRELGLVMLAAAEGSEEVGNE